MLLGFRPWYLRVVYPSFGERLAVVFSRSISMNRVWGADKAVCLGRSCWPLLVSS